LLGISGREGTILFSTVSTNPSRWPSTAALKIFACGPIDAAIRTPQTFLIIGVTVLNPLDLPLP
jgi:hypothetical protein